METSTVYELVPSHRAESDSGSEPFIQPCHVKKKISRLFASPRKYNTVTALYGTCGLRDWIWSVVTVQLGSSRLCKLSTD